MQFDRIVLQVSTHLIFFDLTSLFQEGSHDIISHRNVVPPGEYTRSVPPHICSSIRQFLIRRTFELVVVFGNINSVVVVVVVVV